MGQLIEEIKKDGGSESLALAVEQFIKENKLHEDKVTSAVLNKNKVILRSYFWTLEENRNAEGTIYHGISTDIFSWECNTRTSGTLFYDEDLTMEYMYKTSN